MNKIKTYIINLKDSSDRRAYMEEVMSPFRFLDVEFVEAVDGRKMSPEEIETCFNQSKAHRRYGRILRGGEIGCTLSHKLCAQKLLNSNLPYALFLEDDLIWQAADLEGLFQEIGHLLDSKRPIVVLLSGDYWYLHLSRFYREYAIAHVTDAVCTQSYFINRAGAERLVKIGNWHLADDWRALRRFGMRIYAVHPHVADQNRADIDTVIAPVYGGQNRKEMTLPNLLASYWKSAANKFLVKLGHFEEKHFTWKK